MSKYNIGDRVYINPDSLVEELGQEFGLPINPEYGPNLWELFNPGGGYDFLCEILLKMELTVTAWDSIDGEIKYKLDGFSYWFNSNELKGDIKC